MNRQRLLSGPLNAALIEATSRWLQSLGAEFGFSQDDLYRIEVCFEELVANVVNHSDPEHAGQRVDLHALIEPRRAVFTLSDPAGPFDPLQREAPAVAGSIDEMQIGGQGIPLVRELSEAQRYARHDGRNVVELAFELAQDARVADAGPAPAHVGAVEIFQGVSDAAIDALIAPLAIQQVAGEVLLLEPGAPNEAVRIVLQGRLRVYLDRPLEGDFMAIGAGACVGEMSLIDDRPVSAYVVAEAGTRLLVVDAATFLERLMAIPRVSRNLISTLSNRMRRNDQLAIQRMRKVLELEQAQRELQYARAIQASLLPQEPLFPDEPRLDCTGRMCTAREVGGDFYDIFPLDARHVFFVMADVCGKGLPAALFMVRAIAALRAQSAHAGCMPDHASRVVGELNEQLCTHNDAQQFLTAFCGILDLDTLTLSYVNAGHNPPLLAVEGGPFEYLAEPINPIVGMIEGLAYRAGEVRLGAGGMLLLYTDGVTEAENAQVDMLGEERLKARLNALRARRARDLVDAVFNEVQTFVGDAPQSDDITVLAIRCPA